MQRWQQRRNIVIGDWVGDRKYTRVGLCTVGLGVCVCVCLCGAALSCVIFAFLTTTTPLHDCHGNPEGKRHWIWHPPLPLTHTHTHTQLIPGAWLSEAYSYTRGLPLNVEVLRGTTCGEESESRGRRCTFSTLSLFVVFPTSSKQTDCKHKFTPSFIFHVQHLLEMFKFHVNFKSSVSLFLSYFWVGGRHWVSDGKCNVLQWLTKEYSSHAGQMQTKTFWCRDRISFMGPPVVMGKWHRETDRNLSSTIPGLSISPNKHSERAKLWTSPFG